MTSDDDLRLTSSDQSLLLEKALEKNQGVQDTIENCAVELAAVVGR